MKLATRKLLESLEEISWFSAVGKPELQGSAVFVMSWKQALDYCRAESWQDIRTDQCNLMREQLTKEQLHQWNPLVAHLKPHVIELSETKIAEFGGDIADRREIIATVQWDLLNACLEWEYDDILHTRFYRNVAEWYLRGHFPCGYVENSEQGVHIVL